ncbi:large ribosomal subunit protein uL18m-like [Watersipora subatra]|uniref:large ribosomal subunit protein uL18m-like n=1 Tax=Watersipora subatra TaxID=2589382 RepID=UPI00355B62AB
MQVRSISCCARFCRPLPVSAKDDIMKYGISNEFVNRNPRNLEMIGIAYKRRGWQFQAPRKDFYHRLSIERERKHTTATLIHTSGHTVVTASTREPSLAQHLKSMTDLNACFNIGRVIAHRCHQIGIDSMIFDTDARGESIDKFKEAVLEGGLVLEEVVERPYAEDEVGTDYY